jgi:hypothetical protein
MKLATNKNMNIIKLIDIKNYLQINFGLIIFAAFVGLSASLIYCLVTPKLYEASFTLRLARIDSLPGKSYTNENLGKEIPFILDAQRALGNPAYPSPKLLSSCGLSSTNESIKKLIAETRVMRSPDNRELFIQLRVPGRDNAANCAQAIVEMSLKAYEARKSQVLEEILAQNPAAKIQNFAILDPSLNGVVSTSDSYVYPSFLRIIIGGTIFSILGLLYLNWVRKKIVSVLRAQE